MRSKLIEIQMSRCRLYLTEPELQNLLSINPALWEEAIRRGKGIQRARVARDRNSKETMQGIDESGTRTF